MEHKDADSLLVIPLEDDRKTFICVEYKEGVLIRLLDKKDVKNRPRDPTSGYLGSMKKTFLTIKSFLCGYDECT